MNSKLRIEHTQQRVSNGGDENRKYNLSVDVRRGTDGEITQIANGSILLLDDRNIGGFGAPEMDGFSLNINSGYQCDRVEVFAEVDSFIAAIKEEEGGMA